MLTLTTKPQPDTTIIAANIVTFVASLAVCQLSFFEHGRSVKPSTLLTFYFLVSILCDGVNLFSIYRHDGQSTIAALLTAAAGLKFILLVLESFNKRSYLREPYKNIPIEQSVSVLSRIFLFWVNDEILKGNAKLLSISDMPDLDEPLRSRGLRTRMEAAWEKTCKYHTIQM